MSYLLLRGPGTDACLLPPSHKHGSLVDTYILVCAYHHHMIAVAWGDEYLYSCWSGLLEPVGFPLDHACAASLRLDQTLVNLDMSPSAPGTEIHVDHAGVSRHLRQKASSPTRGQRA